MLKDCSACKQELPKEVFSTKQWRAKRVRRCSNCIVLGKEIWTAAEEAKAAQDDAVAEEAKAEEAKAAHRARHKAAQDEAARNKAKMQSKIRTQEQQLVANRAHACSTTQANIVRRTQASSKGQTGEELVSLLGARTVGLRGEEELVRAAEEGEVAAQYALANMYDQPGGGVLRDAKKAVKWWTKAAKQGHAKSQRELALMYYSGDGVAKDAKKAVAWFTKAAEQGFAEAQHALASRYYRGDGVAKDLKIAGEWWVKAAEQGHAAAQFELAHRYAFGEGVLKDPPRAEKWMLKSAERGYMPSRQFLARFPNWQGVLELKSAPLKRVGGAKSGAKKTSRSANDHKHIRRVAAQEVARARKEAEEAARLAVEEEARKAAEEECNQARDVDRIRETKGCRVLPIPSTALPALEILEDVPDFSDRPVGLAILDTETERLAPEISRLMNEKCIMRCRPPTDGCGRAYMSNGKLRIDYSRALLPKMEDPSLGWSIDATEFLAAKTRGTVFSLIQLWHDKCHWPILKMHPSGMAATAFTDGESHFVWRMAPKDLPGSASLFHRTISRLFKGVPNCCVLVDKILVFSDTAKEHLQVHMKEVMNVITKNDLCIVTDWSPPAHSAGLTTSTFAQSASGVADLLRVHPCAQIFIESSSSIQCNSTMKFTEEDIKASRASCNFKGDVGPPARVLSGRHLVGTKFRKVVHLMLTGFWRCHGPKFREMWLSLSEEQMTRNLRAVAPYLPKSPAHSQMKVGSLKAREDVHGSCKLTPEISLSELLAKKGRGLVDLFARRANHECENLQYVKDEAFVIDMIDAGRLLPRVFRTIDGDSYHMKVAADPTSVAAKEMSELFQSGLLSYDTGKLALDRQFMINLLLLLLIDSFYTQCLQLPSPNISRLLLDGPDAQLLTDAELVAQRDQHEMNIRRQLRAADALDERRGKEIRAAEPPPPPKPEKRKKQTAPSREGSKERTGEAGKGFTDLQRTEQDRREQSLSRQASQLFNGGRRIDKITKMSELESATQSRGWTQSKSNGGHWIFSRPVGTTELGAPKVQKVTVASTPSDRRSWQNIKSDFNEREMERCMSEVGL
jgi:TPR repeat protein